MISDGELAHYLPIYLQQVSQDIGLNYVDCSIRQPKTRWGSCTSKHDIMLNSTGWKNKKRESHHSSAINFINEMTIKSL